MQFCATLCISFNHAISRHPLHLLYRTFSFTSNYTHERKFKTQLFITRSMFLSQCSSIKHPSKMKPHRIANCGHRQVNRSGTTILRIETVVCKEKRRSEFDMQFMVRKQYLQWLFWTDALRHHRHAHWQWMWIGLYDSCNNQRCKILDTHPHQFLHSLFSDHSIAQFVKSITLQ